jgi:hypothetical protein
MKTYTNPRLSATIADWPYGSMRTTATFEIEQTSRGERGTRITIDPKSGRPTARKVLTYATKARIVDGDDGRTYIAELTAFWYVSIMRGDMKISEEAIFNDDPRYPDLLALFA